MIKKICIWFCMLSKLVIGILIIIIGVGILIVLVGFNKGMEMINIE